MAVSAKVEKELLRKKYLDLLSDFLVNLDEEVMDTKSNQICFPVVGCEDNEYFLLVTVTIPTGANKGTEPYDGYEMARDYRMKLEEKERKRKEKEEQKKKKMERDKEIREKKKAIAEKGGQQSTFFVPLHQFT